MYYTKRVLLSISIVVFFSTLFVYGQSNTERPTAWATKITSTSLKNLYKINDSIYRCEQPDNTAFQELSNIGIKSLLDLKKNHTDSTIAGQNPVHIYNVGMDSDNFTDKEIIAALKIILHAPKPIAVHCQHGADRTGVVIAMYRICFQNWTKEQAIDELRNGGYNFHENHINIPKYINDVDVAKIKKSVFSNIE